MWILVAYIISVLLSGGAIACRYLDYRDKPYGYLDKLFAGVTPFIPLVNLLVMLGIIDEYMRKNKF